MRIEINQVQVRHQKASSKFGLHPIAWGCPNSVDRSQGSTGVSVRVFTNCCS
jgi:hypothetical protein